MKMNTRDYPTLHPDTYYNKRNSVFIAVLYFTVTVGSFQYKVINSIWS
jgi:hypothetical protein